MHDERIVPVQLALFGQMFKGSSLGSRALKKVGGAQGVGETFLEETFNGPAASPGHRLHQRAARAVLGASWPIKTETSRAPCALPGAFRSIRLHAASRKKFESFMRIL